MKFPTRHIHKHKLKTFMNHKLLLLCCLLIYNMSTPAQGQNIDALQINKKISVLNDRAFFNFPPEAYGSAESKAQSSADTKPNIESMVTLEIGKMKMVFMAKELFLLGDREFLTYITLQNQGIKWNTKSLSAPNNVQLILSTPTVYDSTKGYMRINSLLVVTADNTIFRVDVYIDKPGYYTAEQFQKLSERILSSFSNGTRMNNLSARQEKIPIYGTSKALLFDLPANYQVASEHGDYHQNFDFNKFKHYTDKSIFHLSIFQKPTSWGQGIEFLHTEYELSESDGKKLKGTFLSEQVDWLYFDLKKERLYLKEFIQDPQCVSTTFHVSILSQGTNMIDELTRIVEKVKVVNK